MGSSSSNCKLNRLLLLLLILSVIPSSQRHGSSLGALENMLRKVVIPFREMGGEQRHTRRKKIHLLVQLALVEDTENLRAI